MARLCWEEMYWRQHQLLVCFTVLLEHGYNPDKFPEKLRTALDLVRFPDPTCIDCDFSSVAMFLAALAAQYLTYPWSLTHSVTATLEFGHKE